MSTLKVKIYYEDTDAGGIVYHANYLKYLERGRTEFLAERGINIAEYHRNGTLFVVSHIEISYKKPAFLGDTLEVHTEIEELKKVSMTIKNKIKRGEDIICEALVTIACLNEKLKPRRLPEEVFK
ncbi:MAG: tol-pal system-associated acyl-CoA thioesterase [Proteobacteria bacterium]|nr:tol-pal system-associated acyl-CoA thioesterase [Pseudomonadota bacterium]